MRARPLASAARLATWAGTVALLLWAVPALAHVALRSATPAANAQLDVAPRELRLAFTAPVELDFARLTLIGPDGDAVALGQLRNGRGSDSLLVAPIAGELSAGTHTVRWQIAGPDGHPVRGEYSFTITAGATGLSPAPAVAGPTAPGQAAPPAEHHESAIPTSDFDAESPLYAAVRWLTFLGLLGVIGAVAFRVLVLRRVGRGTGSPAGDLRPGASRRAASFALGALALLTVALVLRLYAQSVALHGAAFALHPERIAAMLTRTTWGWGWLLQAAGILVVLLGFFAARRGRELGWALALVGAIALAFTPSLSGHAVAAQELSTLAVLADGLHVLGAGGWLGSLLLVVVVGIPVALALEPGRRATAVAALINAFSPTALAFAGLVVATGLFSAWLHLGSVSALWESGYGRTLLLKIAVLTVVFGTGAYNWLRVKPSLGTERAATHLRRSATIELAVGALVLAVTAFLVATPPPMDMESAAMSGQSAGAASAPLHSSAAGETVHSVSRSNE
jgi:putative copper export protein/methionine-rich copper-binding protein CopC